MHEMAQNIKVASSEFSRIDSMAKVNYFEAKMQQLRLDKDKILLGEQQKQLFYNDLMRLQSIKSSNETNLAIYTTPVNLPAGLVVNPVPVNGRFKYALTGIIYGFIFAFLLSVFIDKRKMIFAFLKNN